MINNSIVTRAGPSLSITGIEKKDAPQRVYNFTVEEFHSYLVGKSALWTHNINCEFLDALRRDPAQALTGKSLAEMKASLGALHDPYIEGVMQHSQSNPGGGWTLREQLPNGEFSDFYLQWHPGGSRHHPEFGDSPYWKFSSSTTGTIRVISR